MTPEISILIVSYNTREMTLEALRSVRRETRIAHEIIVVDNASTDGSAEAIATEFPDVLLIAESRNHGFGYANNLASRRARGRYLLLLNPDTVVLDGAIDRLVEFAAARPEARIWGGRTLYGDGSLNPTNCYADMTLWSLFCRATGLTALLPSSQVFNPESYGNWERDTERQVDVVTGCFLLIEREVWNGLGGFDPTYVMFGEEVDLCLRARAQGARPMVTPAARIIHYVGASEPLRWRRKAMVLKAKATLIRRHFRRWQRPLSLALLQAWPLSRIIATGLLCRLPGAERPRREHRAWRQIWSCRSEWMAGYPAAAHAADRPADV